MSGGDDGGGEVEELLMMVFPDGRACNTRLPETASRGKERLQTISSIRPVTPSYKFKTI